MKNIRQDRKSPSRTIDFSLYLVTDRELSLERDLAWIVEESVKGGVTVVQLREKDLSGRDFNLLARRLKELLSRYNVPLLINDRIDIALAAGADGVHLGQSDIPPLVARQIMGEKAIIGLSVENLSQIEEANSLDIDYIALSPLYSTPTKKDTVTEWGLSGLRKGREISVHPVVAIGSIKADNVTEIVKAGADGIAVVSAICSAPEPCSSARELKELILQTRRGE